MRGDLSDTPAADVCRALAVAEATGILEIEGPDGRGAVVCRDGHVIAASSPTPRARLGDRLVNAGLLDEDALDDVLRSQARAASHQRLGGLLVERGVVSLDAVRLVVQEQVIDAVFDVLRWRYGGFRFDAGELAEVPEVPLRIPVDQLLVEVARRQNEWDDLEQVIPDLEAVPAFPPGVGTAAASLEPDEFTMLASIDGSRTVRELADDLGYGEFEAARIVYGLTLLGVVEVRLPEDEVGRALEDALQELAAADLDEVAPVAEPPAASPPSPPPAEPPPSPPPVEPPPSPPRPEPPPSDGGPEPTSEPVVWSASASPAAPVAADPASLDSPPGLVDVARLLAELETDAGGPSASATAPTDGPVEPDPPVEPGDADEPAVAAPPPPGPRPDGGDVAELLRELSRLALDDSTDEPPHAPPPPHRPGGAPDVRRSEPPRDEPPKRRRRFGRS